ncbi:hypothetical protein O181_053759 [Austropuccinia psidii MF-1]|uniref:Uncharacterized protein n=1 Tax=Austropuccinia psidii MF-1 TaxID=1389203 RepID=A0A9Q3HSZ1_9BASI|nr:hypothetical protein [Austropuccinia psidii MF-1]
MLIHTVDFLVWGVLVGLKEDLSYSTIVDEICVDSLGGPSLSDMVDEVHANEEESHFLDPLTDLETALGIGVIGLQHPTLVSSDIDNLNTLPYPRSEDALLSLEDITPQNFKGALQ